MNDFSITNNTNRSTTSSNPPTGDNAAFQNALKTYSGIGAIAGGGSSIASEVMAKRSQHWANRYQPDKEGYIPDDQAKTAKNHYATAKASGTLRKFAGHSGLTSAAMGVAAGDPAAVASGLLAASDQVVNFATGSVKKAINYLYFGDSTTKSVLRKKVASSVKPVMEAAYKVMTGPTGQFIKTTPVGRAASGAVSFGGGIYNAQDGVKALSKALNPKIAPDA